MHKNYKELVRYIVGRAKDLTYKHTNISDAPVNYVCIFSQSDEEFEFYCSEVGKDGGVAINTGMGPVYRVKSVETDAGPVSLVKVRKHDAKRTELGDADFTASDYNSLKSKYLSSEGWDIIVRPNMEMLELSDPNYDVLAYFSFPTLEATIGSSKI